MALRNEEGGWTANWIFPSKALLASETAQAHSRNTYTQTDQHVSVISAFAAVKFGPHSGALGRV